MSRFNMDSMSFKLEHITSVNIVNIGLENMSRYNSTKKENGLQIKEFQIHSPHQDQTLVRHEDRPPLREAAVGAMVKAGQNVICGVWGMLIHTTMNPYQWIDDHL